MYPLPDYTPGQCDPDGDTPCCSSGWDGECGNTPEHCNCWSCTNYTFVRDWWESNGTQKWRYDGKCGGGYSLPDGTRGQCDPDGDKPCCSRSGECGNTTEHCSCSSCTDHRILYREWRESNGTQKWRYDGKCGSDYPLPDGKPGQCDPDGDKPCCSSRWYGECGNSTKHCSCNGCSNYTFVRDWWESGGTQKWRDDGKCGRDYPLPDGKRGQCDPDGDKPCCSGYWGGQCGNTTEHCTCWSCTNYTFVRDWWESGGTQKWRYDGKCGKMYPLPDDTPGQCDPDGDKPCCSGYWGGQCGNTTEHCTCDDCSDYRRILREWRESNGTQKWRYDGNCGIKFPLPDGTPGQCDPDGDKPCCSWWGNCGNSNIYCLCTDCVDYKLIKDIRNSAENCTLRKYDGFLKLSCFDKISEEIYHKCLYSDVYYKSYFRSYDSIDFISFIGVSEKCENDPHVYQACWSPEQMTNTDVLCEGFICKQKQNGKYEYITSTTTKEQCEPDSTKFSNTQCNDVCEESDCEDEALCNGYMYGLFCNDYYVSIDTICDGDEDCHDVRSDEENCNVSDSTVSVCSQYKRNHAVVPIHNYTRCMVFDFEDSYYPPYCYNFLDQTNCSDIERVGGYCEVNGYESSVSKYMLCFEYDPRAKLPIQLCDDDFQNNCINASASDCRIHKHWMCDGVKDCDAQLDETDDMCSVMSDKFNLVCKRRFQQKSGETTIPIAWIMDNETDCVNGEDENPKMWRFCKGEYEYVTSLQDESCQDVFKCPREENSFIQFEKLCDGVESCEDKAEIEVCKIARDFPTINRTVFSNHRARDVCNFNSSLTCEVREFIRPWGEVFGENRIELNVPTTKVDCNKLFGEYYLFLSCMNLCFDPNTPCPLEGSNRKLNYNSCEGQYSDRAYTLGNNSFLTFVDESNNGQYHQDIYLCDTDKCIEYKQVCDLVDDCGDMSDEINCTNHMICEDTKNSRKHHFISLSQKCDGIYDCFDISDECNDTCGKEILDNWGVKVMCWLMGTLAMFFNLFAAVRGFHSLKDCETEKMMTSKALMSLIGSGDFLIGTYLVILSFYDSIIFGEEFCQKQPEWLTGTPCIVLGVISTLGSQISLFTMTVLSIIRMYGLTCTPMRVPGPVTRKSILKVTSLGMLTVMAALAIAIVPLIPSLEDYFVQGMFYDDAYRVFIGFPNKERHVKILQAYYNENGTENVTNISGSMTWNEIGKRVDGMFSQDHGNLTRTPVHFYGNDGVCLFKYFVRTDDARRSRQSLETGTSQMGFNGDPVVWTMLAVNLFCFIVITCCYIVITCKTRQSSQRSGQQNNQDRQREERAIQNKIMLIIATDFFCWVPFIIISALHNLEYIDASKWYASFAMTVLPLNSVVNPLVYDKALVEIISQQAGKLSTVVKLGTSSFIANILARLRGVTSNEVACDNTNDINLTNLDKERCVVGTAHDGVAMNANDSHSVNDNVNNVKNLEFYECDNFNEIEI